MALIDVFIARVFLDHFRMKGTADGMWVLKTDGYFLKNLIQKEAQAIDNSCATISGLANVDDQMFCFCSIYASCIFLTSSHTLTNIFSINEESRVGILAR